ncbi:hypothetical protein L3Y34_019814 [Caenorhabditis briggsae]|uniref:Uncharacterized protein n=1 Tax=Caenorhabditis briggsae TaxID=6238 RepID=A0AAE9DP49_CAEBR|nr:hypothetical protein L3Y34_019814 [Caenorhabditis briggsae]
MLNDVAPYPHIVLPASGFWMIVSCLQKAVYAKFRSTKPSSLAIPLSIFPCSQPPRPPTARQPPKCERPVNGQEDNTKEQLFGNFVIVGRRCTALGIRDAQPR